MRHLPIVLAALLAAAMAACGVDAETDTGLRLVVTLDESLPPEAVPSDLNTLRFYVATQADEQGKVWVLNEALAGRPVDITGRDLASDPYKLFVGSRARPPETVRVLVVAESGGVPVLGGTLSNPASQTLQAGKILERTVRLRKAEEMPSVTWTDTGCLLSEDGRLAFGSSADQDCDGYLGSPTGDDCNDLDPGVHPGADDQHDCDGVDNDCDGVVDPGGHEDSDGDGFTPCDGDCDDRDPDVHKGAQEKCDGKDNNCNGKCDEYQDLWDADNDGYTTCGTLLINGGETCEPAPYPDCDDTSKDIHPGAEEAPDGLDNNCNGLCDEGTDKDGDGFNPAGTQNGPVPAVDPNSGLCPPGRPEWVDCDEGDANIYPGAPEICDGKNDDCDDTTHPEPALCYAPDWETGECMVGHASCDDTQGTWGQCALDTTNPSIVAQVRCRAWDECSQRPDPSLCISQLLATIPLDCTVHMRSPGIAPCADDPPIYALPFGTTGMTNCTWTLQLPTVQPGWYAVGLVDPYDPNAIVTNIVQSCQAYLLARPYSENGTPAATLSGFLNLEADDPSGLLLVETPITVSSDIGDGCGMSTESMECHEAPLPN